MAVQWPDDKNYDGIVDDIRTDFVGYHMNLYECKFAFYPDNEYHTLHNNLAIKNAYQK